MPHALMTAFPSSLPRATHEEIRLSRFLSRVATLTLPPVLWPTTVRRSLTAHATGRRACSAARRCTFPKICLSLARGGGDAPAYSSVPTPTSASGAGRTPRSVLRRMPRRTALRRPPARSPKKRTGRNSTRFLAQLPRTIVCLGLVNKAGVTTSTKYPLSVLCNLPASAAQNKSNLIVGSNCFGFTLHLSVGVT